MMPYFIRLRQPTGENLAGIVHNPGYQVVAELSSYRGLSISLNLILARLSRNTYSGFLAESTLV